MSRSQAIIQNEGDTTLVERLANRVGRSVDARHIYGEPVERDGVTVVPVSRAAYAFGGGGGKTGEEEGSGGGGGVVLKPVGYIEMKNGKTRFRPIRDPLIYAATAAGLAPVIILAALRLSRFFRKSEN